MIFTQHYLGCLSHASYVVGDETTGRAVVVDPRRDVQVYLEEAAERGLTIERVIETHIHADFLSGHLELAAATGAVIAYGDGADVEFAIKPLHDGERLSLGDVTLEILATPGHTPESICIVVYEHGDDEIPYGVLTGDTLFVGDVGRPDLLASGAGGRGPGEDVDLSADAMARRLYHSLHDKLLPLPDATRIFPAHGAGSSCGKQLSSETSSTLGEQRQVNYALQYMGEDEFVAAVTEGQLARPHYFEFDSRRNRVLRPLFNESAAPLFDVDEVLARQAAGAVLLDVREPADFAAGHLIGAVNVGLQGRFAEWAGDVLSPERDLVLVGDPVVALEAKVRLARVGYDRVVGQLDEPARVFVLRPEVIETSSRLTIEQLAELRGLEPGLQVVDVRAPGETAGGTLPGAREIPLAVLADSMTGLDPARPVVVYCAGGYRSQVAASVLSEAGFMDVSDLLGGYGAWAGAGLPTSTTGTGGGIEATLVGARAGKALVEAGALLLDVREPDEWDLGHAPGAWLVPMGQVRGRQDQLPRDRRIVVVCRSGGRSGAVTESLLASGFDAVNLSGGMCAWTAAGLPVVVDRPEAGLVVHREHPLNCETSIPALIGGVVMPNARFYVRNHFETPRLDPGLWRLGVGGLVDHPLQLSLRDLHNMASHTLVATLECAGNGRFVFDPPAEGEQWQLGAVSTAEWSGVPLVEVLDRAGVKPGAREIVFRGADKGSVEGSAGTTRFERSHTVDEARTCGALLAYAMNGEPLPIQHGYPLRLIVPGWYAVASVKWLTDIDLIGADFDGFFQTQRYFYEWERDGATVREPVRLQQVRSVITEPTAADDVAVGDLIIRGVAWSGAAPIARVDVSIGGGTWQPARLVGERHRHCWQWWELSTELRQPGVVNLRARATDLAGRSQPEEPEWNRLGYGGNAIQSVTIKLR